MSSTAVTASTFSKPIIKITRGHNAPNFIVLDNYTHLKVSFDPYSHIEVQNYIKQIYKEFGRDKTRWYYKSADIDEIKENCWVIDFAFSDPIDATMFALKYAR